mmetsp:Transcript_10231/g.38001  ORF Transcript_10231/g.38001 Transcript_10231/m.38001 type:complete len:545 (-) Transcript_10231:1899-3533(-)
MRRLRSSCRACHKSHKKCDGSNDEPCTRCQKRNESCVWDAQRKRGPKRKRNDLEGDEQEWGSMSATLSSGGGTSGGDSADGAPDNENAESSFGNHAKKMRKTLNGDVSTDHSASPPFTSVGSSLSDLQNTIFIQVLLAGSGSVACIKIPELVHKLATYRSIVSDDKGQEWHVRFRVSVVLTESATRFITKKQILDYVDNAPALNNNHYTAGESQQQTSNSPTTRLSKEIQIFQDEDEWRKWRKIGDEVTHIEMRQQSDIMLIAPLSANTLAKIANGLCDNLLTCVVRAWDFVEKPMIACPAMNTVMWNSFFTSRHLDVLQRELGMDIVHPVSKKLACGESGIGALAYVDDIVRRTIQVVMHSVIQTKISERGGGKLIQPRDYSVQSILPPTSHLLPPPSAGGNATTTTSVTTSVSNGPHSVGSVNSVIGPNLPPPSSSSSSHAPEPSHVHSSGYATTSYAAPPHHASSQHQYGSSAIVNPQRNEYVLPPSYTLHSSPPQSHIAPPPSYNPHLVPSQSPYIHSTSGATPYHTATIPSMDSHGGSR